MTLPLLTPQSGHRIPFSFVKNRHSWPLLGLGMCALAMPVAAQFQPPEIQRPPTAPVAKPAPRPASPSPEDKAKTQALQQQVRRAEKEITLAKKAHVKAEQGKQQLADDLAKAERDKQQLADELAAAKAALRKQQTPEPQSLSAIQSKAAAAPARFASQPQQKANPAAIQLNGFTLLPGGTARDEKTGLEWMRCSLGQTWDGNTCRGEAKTFTFEQAQQAAKDLNAQGGFAGKTNWRVPTAPELFGLVVCSTGIGKYTTTVEGQTLKDGCLGEEYATPTIVQGIFPDTLAMRFWSSSAYAGGFSGAWYVNFTNGGVYPYGNGNYYAYHVRLVR